jgi:hypothetical protein
MNIISVLCYLLSSLLYASYCIIFEEINYLYLYPWYLVKNLAGFLNLAGYLDLAVLFS